MVLNEEDVEEEEEEDEEEVGEQEDEEGDFVIQQAIQQQHHRNQQQQSTKRRHSNQQQQTMQQNHVTAAAAGDQTATQAAIEQESTLLYQEQTLRPKHVTAGDQSVTQAYIDINGQLHSIDYSRIAQLITPGTRAPLTCQQTVSTLPGCSSSLTPIPAVSAVEEGIRARPLLHELTAASADSYSNSMSSTHEALESLVNNGAPMFNVVNTSCY